MRMSTMKNMLEIVPILGNRWYQLKPSDLNPVLHNEKYAQKRIKHTMNTAHVKLDNSFYFLIFLVRYTFTSRGCSFWYCNQNEKSKYNACWAIITLFCSFLSWVSPRALYQPRFWETFDQKSFDLYNRFLFLFYNSMRHYRGCWSQRNKLFGNQRELFFNDRIRWLEQVGLKEIQEFNDK